MDCNILELFAKRHSFYEINNKCPLEMAKVTALVKRAMELYPSPFNSQSARIMLLSDLEHHKFWKIVLKKLLESSSKEKYDDIRRKNTAFAAGCGTILFFVDEEIVKQQETHFPLYAQNFMNWANQSNAILQFMIWTAFANNGIGASLQHYSPLIDNDLHSSFGVPLHWKPVAQMPYGGIVRPPAAHSVVNLENKILIHS